MGKRFVTEFQVYQPEQAIQFIIQDYFRKEGFTQTEYKGERVWKKGVGVLTAPQFMRVMYNRGWIRLEAWLKYAVLPGVYCGEMGLEGFFGFAIKEQLRSRVVTLMSLLQQPNYSGNWHAASTPVCQSAAQPSDISALQSGVRQEVPGISSQPQLPQSPLGVQGSVQPPHPVMVHNPTKQATISLVMGLVGIIAWIIPFAGITVSVIGIVTGTQGMRSTAKNQATAGFVLSVVFLIVSVIAFILNMAQFLAWM